MPRKIRKIAKKKNPVLIFFFEMIKNSKGDNNVEPKKGCCCLKSVNSNFTLAVRSRKFGQAKTQFLSHHNVCYVFNRVANFPSRDQWSNG